MFHYIFAVRRNPSTDTSDYQGLGTPDPHPTGHSLFKLGKTQDLRETELWMAFFGHLEIAEADRRWDEALAAGRSIEDLVREVRGAPLRARARDTRRYSQEGIISGPDPTIKKT